MNMPHDAPHCKTSMLWNTSILDACIVFRGWHISSYAQFALSCVAVLALGVAHEGLRRVQRALDARIAAGARPAGGHADVDDAASPSASRVRLVEEGAHGAALAVMPVPLPLRALRAALYGTTVFLSFFLMLVFMTYNAYLIASVVIGAVLGNFIFGATMTVDSSGNNSLACH